MNLAVNLAGLKACGNNSIMICRSEFIVINMD
nr:MAG TPA: hypothetical protein [Caudoviricetes sp.]